jgi:hypothetical protein
MTPPPGKRGRPASAGQVWATEQDPLSCAIHIAAQVGIDGQVSCTLGRMDLATRRMIFQVLPSRQGAGDPMIVGLEAIAASAQLLIRRYQSPLD